MRLLRRSVLSLTLGVAIGIAGGVFLGAVDAASAWFYALAIVLVIPVVVQGLYPGRGLPPIRWRRSGAKVASSAGWSSRTVFSESAFGSASRAERCVFVGRQSSFARLHEEMHPRDRQRLMFVASVSLPDGFSKQSALGTNVAIRQVIDSLDVDRLVVEVGPDFPERELDFLMHEVKVANIQVSSLPAWHEPTASLIDQSFQLSSWARFVKRTLDVVVSASALVLLAPVLASISLAIRLGSPGPVMFRQRRVGQGGRTFTLLKFRTMVADSVVSPRAGVGGELESTSTTEPEPLFMLRADPRITRIGRFLRRTSLDELPALWNVLRGDMSVVGPRPMLEIEAERIEHAVRERREALKPGVTGLWQVMSRDALTYQEMLELDSHYVMTWSFWTDVKLLFRTFLLPIRKPPLYTPVRSVRPSASGTDTRANDENAPRVLVATPRG